MPSPGNRPSTWTAEEIKRVGYHVIDLIAEHLSTLPDGPVFRPVPASLAEQFLSVPVPADGIDPDRILEEFRDAIAPYPFGNGHPRFWGWVNSPPAVMGIMADALAAAMNPSCAGGNHAAIYVERQVLNWFKEMLGFPPDSMGLLVSGGSMANLTALAVARHAKAGFDVRRSGLQGAERTLVLYLSDEGHGCMRKAAELMGIGSENVRTVAVDANFRMRVDDLETQITADLAAGDQPFAVAASAGTVNPGAIDPLREIAEVCRRHRLWFHVDGAYGAPAVLANQYREELAAIALADCVSSTTERNGWIWISWLISCSKRVRRYCESGLRVNFFSEEVMKKVNLAEKFAQFHEHWRPKVVGELNGQEVKLVKCKGAFVWHHHEVEDELFLVSRGCFRVEFRDRTVELQAGEFLIVPHGVEHRTVADEEAEVLVFEPAATRNTGNIEHLVFTAPLGVRL